MIRYNNTNANPIIAPMVMFGSIMSDGNVEIYLKLLKIPSLSAMHIFSLLALPRVVWGLLWQLFSA